MTTHAPPSDPVLRSDLGDATDAFTAQGKVGARCDIKWMYLFYSDFENETLSERHQHPSSLRALEHVVVTSASDLLNDE